MAGGYVIQVGNERPGEAIIATPNKKTGEPQGPQMKTFIRVGVHLIMNQCTVWGRRLINSKPKADGTEIEFNSIGYKGELEFLPWGSDGGYAIVIRYIPQSRSLDYEYQTNVQKINIDPNKGMTQIELKAGQNKFDYKKDDLLIKFWQVHPQNRDSKSKNPNPEIKGYQFYELTDDHVDSRSVKMIETSGEATSLLKSISIKPEKVRNLFELLSKNIKDELGNTDLLSGDAEVYKTLLEYAYHNSEDFFSWIATYKREVEDAFEKAKSYRVLDLTKDGHIALEIDGKKNLIISEVKAKGENMIHWMIENYLEDEVYKATQVLKEIVSKLK